MVWQCLPDFCVSVQFDHLSLLLHTPTSNTNAVSSYSCALQPISGKLFQYFSLKWTYLAYVFVFELGSLICATAVSSKMLIIGRAVAGMGAAGLFSGGLIILGHSFTPRQRPCGLPK